MINTKMLKHIEKLGGGYINKFEGNKELLSLVPLNSSKINVNLKYVHIDRINNSELFLIDNVYAFSGGRYEFAKVIKGIRIKDRYFIITNAEPYEKNGDYIKYRFICKEGN